MAAGPWVTVASCFHPDSRQLLGLLIPRLMVNGVELRNKPTFGDPLGSKPRLFVQHSSVGPGEYQLKFTLDGVDTPWLAPQAMTVYLSVEYPKLFAVENR